MFTKDQLVRYAEVLWWGLKTARTKPYSQGDTILIRFHRPAIPLAEILYSKFLEKGFNPVIRLDPTPEIERNYYSIADDKQLEFIAPGDEVFYENLNGSVFLSAPEEMTHLKDIDPDKISKTLVSKKHLRDILRKREEIGLLSWTLCVYPTETLAQTAGLSFQQYMDQVVRACFLDESDPVKHWQEIYDNAQSVKTWLNSLSVDHLHIESETCDLKVTLGDSRQWVGISGRNIPSFEIFVSPDWRGTHGIYHADQPSYRSGHLVKNISLKFQNGSLDEVSAEEGQDFAQKQFSMDAGASRVGEFSLTDRRFSRIDRFMANTLYDENFGGTFGNCHIALGSSYSNTYAGPSKLLTSEMKASLGFNDSALHWDLVNTDSKRVTAHLKNGDRLLIYENGQFSV